MLFTRSDAEKVNAVNAQGVRSAQCSSDFDEAWPEHDQLGATHNGSFLIVSDFTIYFIFYRYNYYLGRSRKTRGVTVS